MNNTKIILKIMTTIVLVAGCFISIEVNAKGTTSDVGIFFKKEQLTTSSSSDEPAPPPSTDETVASSSLDSTGPVISGGNNQKPNTNSKPTKGKLLPRLSNKNSSYILIAVVLFLLALSSKSIKKRKQEI